MEDEFTYPQHVQDALDFVEQGTREVRRREADERRYRWKVRESNRERRDRREREQREAASDDKFWEARRKQRASRVAARPFAPAQPEGWTR